ncbi:cytochrome c3 family protein [Adlercreutzia aquisgranensis]|uniref:cytochrome c3 family protein n=1 Tax=Adlercreutzia aquisgranensis TaxID=2941323 RepID=UPI00203ED5F2|nr:cytochrome c3 family protein [Adlercreutzia aquisgranensis]
MKSQRRALTIVLITMILATVAFAGCAPDSRSGASVSDADAQSAAPGESDEDAAADQDEAAPSVAVEWTAQSDCSICHGTEHSSFEDGQTGAFAHAQMADDCMACHEDEAALSEVHEGITMDAKPAKKLKKTEVGEEVCLSCHGDDDFAGATASSEVLVDSNGTVVNPHELPENEEHGQIVCADCHKVHSSTPRENAAQAVCVGCHHSGVYECYTCHE